MRNTFLVAAAVLTWTAPEDSANVAGYRVYWRRTDSPTWDHSTWVGSAREHTFNGLVIDNWFFGVASVGRDGHESTVVFPTPPFPIVMMTPRRARARSSTSPLSDSSGGSSSPASRPATPAPA